MKRTKLEHSERSCKLTKYIPATVLRFITEIANPGILIGNDEGRDEAGPKETDMIQVRRTSESEGDPLSFEVVVRAGKGETRHHVTMSQETCRRLTAGRHTDEQCVDAAFRFLLEREPKESILRTFDVTVISRYFPEFERELPRYLAPG
jgi:hypothetical protein